MLTRFLFISILGLAGTQTFGADMSRCARIVGRFHATQEWVGQVSRFATARRLAATYHAGQTHGILTWKQHLVAIESILTGYGFGYFSTSDLKLRTILKLHDILEDTEIDLARLKKTFQPDEVASVVRLTFPKSLPSNQRGMHLRATLPGDEMAKIAKITDRLANFEQSIIDWHVRQDSFFLEKYIREWSDFGREIIPRDPRGRAMWEHLNRLTNDKTERQAWFETRLRQNSVDAIAAFR